ncbi:hypothetical protein EHQ46_15635 [Leptospira yanagawae]|uniref:Lipoprotein n=1 Tax=Leptospira yanagawae TaxID=293069 RepID=A0ABY2LZZ9_9LEPT|nr:hypothetical protein [Leptospira yanagawae]TGL19218.1 hypothetical protein EHQ46_15635 [Leptospira yanagawae]
MLYQILIPILILFLTTNCKKEIAYVADPIDLNVSTEDRSETLSYFPFRTQVELLGKTEPDPNNPKSIYEKIRVVVDPIEGKKMDGWAHQDGLAKTETELVEKAFLNAITSYEANSKRYFTNAVLHLMNSLWLASSKYEFNSSFFDDELIRQAKESKSYGGPKEMDFCKTKLMLDFYFTKQGYSDKRKYSKQFCEETAFTTQRRLFTYFNESVESITGNPFLVSTEYGFHSVNTSVLQDLFKRMYRKPDQTIFGFKYSELYKKGVKPEMNRFMEGLSLLETIPDAKEFEEWFKKKAKDTKGKEEISADLSYLAFQKEKAEVSGSSFDSNSELIKHWDTIGSSFVMRRKIDGSWNTIRKLLKQILTDYDPDLIKKHTKVLGD